MPKSDAIDLYEIGRKVGYDEGYLRGKKDGYALGYTDCDSDRAQEVIAAFERQRELAREAKECQKAS